jgi:L-ascorbate metabolism protein UlaG (beta-lactamase superfamily)
MAKSTTFPLGPAAERPEQEQGSVLFIGTATTLVHLGPFTILTDPNFLHAGDHAHLGYGLTAKRLTEPALDVDALPPLDACVLSHFHGDHWDQVATDRLPKDLLVLTTRQASRALHRRGFRRAHALATWDDAVLRKGSAWLRVTAMPGRHGPPLVSRLLPTVIGSMWEFGVGAGAARFRMYVSGDTLVHEELWKIPERFPQVDLGLFHLGGTRIFGVLVTMDADQGIDAIRVIQPDLSIPIHFDDYPVFKSPLDDFARAVADAGLAQRVKFLARGERHTFVVGRERGRPAVIHGEARPSAVPGAGPGEQPPGAGR